MNQKLQAFLSDEQVATVAVAIDKEGTLRLATMRCLVTFAPLRVYFVTSPTSEKCGLLRSEDTVKAACEIGGYKDTKMYVQMRGMVKMWQFAEQPEVVQAYFDKRGEPKMKTPTTLSALTTLKVGRSIS